MNFSNWLVETKNTRGLRTEPWCTPDRIVRVDVEVRDRIHYSSSLAADK